MSTFNQHFFALCRADGTKGMIPFLMPFRNIIPRKLEGDQPGRGGCHVFDPTDAAGERQPPGIVNFMAAHQADCISE